MSTRSLAADWLAAGQNSISRSFRLHRPRGAFCHRGWCQQCKVALPDGRVVLACSTYQFEPADSRPLRFDPLRVVGRVAETKSPWFWEEHAFADGTIHQMYLGIMRRLSAAMPLAPVAPREARAETVKVETDTIVVGGGVSGRAAASALSARGIDVVLVDADITDEDDLSGVTMLARYLCVGLYENPRRALCIGPSGNALVHFRRLVVATGAYDRVPTIPGNDLPGIVGVRAFEHLAAQGAVPSALRIGFYGHASEAHRALGAASRAGVVLQFIAGPADLPAVTNRRWPACRLLRATGRGKLQHVEIEGAGILECDLLISGFSQPSYEMQAQNGCTTELRGYPPVVWPVGEGHAPSLVVGEAAGWVETSEIAARSAQAVEQWLAGSKTTPGDDSTHETTASVHCDGDAFVCFCEDVRVRDVRDAIADGYRDIELIKRHTGAATGPCQGKLCHGALLACAAEAGVAMRLPTPRPLARPVSIAALAGAAREARSGGFANRMNAAKNWSR